MTKTEDIRECCVKVLTGKYGTVLPETARQRLQSELFLISHVYRYQRNAVMGFSLLQKLFFDKNLITSTRGACATSYVCYLLGIAQTDPLNMTPAFFYGAPNDKGKSFCVDVNLTEAGRLHVLDRLNTILPDAFDRAQLDTIKETRSDQVIKIVCRSMTETDNQISVTHTGGSFDTVVITITNNNSCMNIKDSLDQQPFNILLYAHRDLCVLEALMEKTGTVPPEGIGCMGALYDMLNSQDTKGLGMVDNPFMKNTFRTLQPASLSELASVFGLVLGQGTYIEQYDMLVKRKISLDDAITSKEDVFYLLIERRYTEIEAYYAVKNICQGSLSSKDKLLMSKRKVPRMLMEKMYVFSDGQLRDMAMVTMKMAFYKVFHEDAFKACAHNR